MDMPADLLAWGGATLASAPLAALVISFFAYGLIGWVWESTVCALLNHGRFANSGFLLGPCCPIYGVGGLACWLLLREVPGTADLFLASAVVCSAIEYAVGLGLEAITGARFWDYSKYPLNLHGRICLYGGLVFGAASVLVCRAAEPALLGLMVRMPSWLLVALALALTACALVDAAFSVASWRRLSATLEALRSGMAAHIDERLQDASDALLDRVPADALARAQTAHVRGRIVNGWLATLSDAAMDALREKVQLPTFVADGREGLRLAARRLRDAAPGLPSLPARPAWARMPRLRRRELRYFNAFPNLKMPRYEGVIRATGLAERARELFGRK